MDGKAGLPADRIQRVAGRQLGLLARGQLLGCGLDDDAIRRWVRAGRLRRVERGLYALPGAVESLEFRALMGCLAVGPDALASHSTGGAVWGFIDADIEWIEVSVPAHRVSRPAGIVVHRTRILRPHERSKCGVVPVTAPMRTIVDLAGSLEDMDVESALYAAIRAGLVDPERLAQYLEDPHVCTRRGTRLLRQLVAVDGFPETALEEEFLLLVRRFALPRPALQYWIDTPRGPRRIDAAYPEARLAIELDGYGSRSGRDPFEDERARQSVIQAMGWRFLRFTWRQVTTHEYFVAFTLAQALGLRPTQWTG